MKNNKITPKKQPPDFVSVRFPTPPCSDRIYSRASTAEITDDVAAAALFEALFDNDRIQNGPEEGRWTTYNVREMRHATNLTSSEQREARDVLKELRLADFRVAFGGVGMEYLINHPLYYEKIESYYHVSLDDLSSVS